MSDKQHIHLINSIHFETELLECLEWDYEKLSDVIKKITEYFSVCSKSDLDLVKVDLGFIFSEEISNIVMKYVRHVNNDIKSRGGNDET